MFKFSITNFIPYLHPMRSRVTDDVEGVIYCASMEILQTDCINVRIICCASKIHDSCSLEEPPLQCGESGPLKICFQFPDNSPPSQIEDVLLVFFIGRKYYQFLCILVRCALNPSSYQQFFKIILCLGMYVQMALKCHSSSGFGGPSFAE